MPKRLDVIQKLIENSCAIKRAGIPDIKLTPEFYSFDFKDGVKFHSNASMASVNEPDYILCFLKRSYDWETRLSHELISIVDVRGYTDDKIEVKNIILSEITLYETNHIKDFKIAFEDQADQQFHFNQVTDNTFTKKLTFHDLWLYCKELNENCGTAKEGIIYLNYFLSYRDSQEKTVSLKEYEQDLLKKKEIIDQYEYLLEKFQEIVEKGQTTSKT